MTLDISLACLHAEVEDGDVFNVEVPPEMEAGHDKVMNLKKGLYSTSRAPMLWQNKSRRALESLNIERCPADAIKMRTCRRPGLDVCIMENHEGTPQRARREKSVANSERLMMPGECMGRTITRTPRGFKWTTAVEYAQTMFEHLEISCNTV